MSKFMDRTTTVDTDGGGDQKVSIRGISAVKQILVFSGSKGGVGKTTTVINLAKALTLQSYHVGIIDMTGSAELALAASSASESTSQKPRQLSGISIVSFCHLKQKHLRLPVASDMLKNKLIEVCDQTSWGKLDFLLIDLPSGNMDLALFIGKNLPACQFLMVTTPAVPAIAELRQDIRLLQMHHITPLGLIENMSFFIGSNSADHLELIGIFSAGGGQRVCQETSIPLLATIPISLDIAAASEAEKPVYEHCPESEVLPYYLSLTKQLLRCCLTG